MPDDIEIIQENTVITLERSGQPPKTIILTKPAFTQEEAEAVSKVIFVDFKARTYSRIRFTPTKKPA